MSIVVHPIVREKKQKKKTKEERWKQETEIGHNIQVLVNMPKGES